MNNIHYKARLLESINNGPGVMNSIKVGIFQEQNGVESIIGQYIRNHPNLYNTFYHFRQDEHDYALYSSDYTATRVMELPSCKDLGGENPSAAGFCPVDFYVPSFIDREFEIPDLQLKKVLKKDALRYRVHDPKPEDLERKYDRDSRYGKESGKEIKNLSESYPVSGLTFYPFGFVAGCIWGDDSSWKLQFLDLSKAAKGIITRQEKFGYLPLVPGMSLKETIQILYDEETGAAPKVEVTTLRYFSIEDGREHSPLDIL